MFKNLYTRIVGLYFIIRGFSFYINLFRRDHPGNPGIIDEKLAKTGFTLLVRGDYNLLIRFKTENKWAWKDESNGVIFLSFCLIALVIIWILAK